MSDYSSYHYSEYNNKEQHVTIWVHVYYTVASHYVLVSHGLFVYLFMIHSWKASRISAEWGDGGECSVADKHKVPPPIKEPHLNSGCNENIFIDFVRELTM